MAKIRNSRIIPTILVVVIVIIAIVAIISGIRAVFLSGPSTSNKPTDNTQQSLLNTSASNSVSMSVRGPIVADENFHSYKIVVSPTSRQITTYNGYLGTVVEQKSLSNNTAAYEEFVNALNLAKMTAGNQPAEGESDIRGVCATGRLTEFAILSNDLPVETLWTSTCSGSQGTLRASDSQLSNLFLAQIPEAKTYARNVSL
jgi:FlaG/FlaF family flagellin (archaellin)